MSDIPLVYYNLPEIKNNLEGGAAEKITNDDIMRHQQMSIYNDRYLNYMEPSKTSLYNIPRGTILYHGSLNRESFNPYDIRLGEDKLVAFFSPNKRLAADYIVGCALYPTKAGFLHKFRVKKDIEKVLIISTYEKQQHWSLKFLEDSFCSRKFRIQLDGVGFFFPRRDEKDFSSIQQGMDAPKRLSFDSEFAICNPNEYLEYISTQRCSSMRKLSKDYHFSK